MLIRLCPFWLLGQGDVRLRTREALLGQFLCEAAGAQYVVQWMDLEKLPVPQFPHVQV